MRDSKINSYAVTTVQFIAILIVVLFFVFMPKAAINTENRYRLAASMAITSENNFVLYNYKVYPTEKRFEENAINDINEIVEKFKKRNEVLAVSIRGDTERIEYIGDYIFIHDPNVPELNIEYYIVKNLKIGDISIPCRSFIMVYEDLAKTVNTLYWLITLSVLIPILLTLSVKVIKNIEKLKK